MKRTKHRDEAKRLKRLNIRCQVCGQAPAVRYNKLGMAVCGKSHALEVNHGKAR